MCGCAHTWSSPPFIETHTHIHREAGLGKAMVQAAYDIARAKGCIDLTVSVCVGVGRGVCCTKPFTKCTYTHTVPATPHCRSRTNLQRACEAA